MARGTTSATNRARRGLIITIITNTPTRVAMPDTNWVMMSAMFWYTEVTSLVIRDSTSPMLVFS